MACILGMHGLFPCLPLLSKQCNITYLTILFLKKMCGCVFCVCMSAWFYVHHICAGAYGSQGTLLGQKNLQIIVSYLIWLLRIEPGFSAREVWSFEWQMYYLGLLIWMLGPQLVANSSSLGEFRGHLRFGIAGGNMSLGAVFESL